MKSSPFTLSFLLASAVLTPSLHGQDASEKIRKIEQKVVLDRYQKAIQSLIQSARDFESGSSGSSPEIVGRHLQWLVTVDSNLDAADKTTALDPQQAKQTAGTLNDLAWNMITSRSQGDRHAEIALKLADLAIELGSGDADLKLKMLDTRARAFFLLGRKDEAIAEQEKAVGAATGAIEKASFEATLAAYRRNELLEVILPAPGIDPTSSNAPSDPKALQRKTEELATLRNRITDAVKQSSRVSSPEIDKLKEDLKTLTAEVAKLADEGLIAQSGAQKIVGKLRTIIIPSIDFENTTLEDAAQFLRKQSIELDQSETDPALRGVNIVVRRYPAGKKPADAEPVRINELRLRNVPLAEALRYVCESTRFRYKVDDFAVTLLTPSSTEDVFTRTFTVPPGFASSLVPIQDLLTMCGIQFGEGASATLTSSDQLVIRNTPTELDKIETLIDTDLKARANRAASDRSGPPGAGQR